MRSTLRRTGAVARAVVHEVRAENITFMAGSIAYHAFVSLLPFLLLVLFVVSSLGGERVANDFLLALAGYLTPDFRRVLVRTATNATSSTGGSLLGVAVLVWGTLRIFRGLDHAFSDIYDSEAANTLVDELTDAVAVFLAIGLAILAVALADEAVGLAVFGPAAVVVRPLLSVAAIALALFPMYFVFPDEDLSIREAVPGAVVAAVGWTLLSSVFGFYVRSSSATEYGVVGVVILLVTWLYFGGFALLLGAAVNAVLSGRSKDVDNVAWHESPGDDPTANDAAFVEPLYELEELLVGDGGGGDGSDEAAPSLHISARDGDATARSESDDAGVTLPPPDQAHVEVVTVDRPRLLGGSEERGRVVLQWESDRR